MKEEQIMGLLRMLKIDLGIMGGAYDCRLTQYIENAAAKITEEGATLDLASLADSQLVVEYAAWTWRRRDTGEGMPRMLRWQLNNRIFSEKMKDG